MSSQPPISDEWNKLRARCERLDSLYQFATALHSTLEPQSALQLIVNEAARLMRASSSSIALVNPTTDFLEIVASTGLPPKAGSLFLRVGEGITGWVARTGRPACVGDVTRDPRYIMLREDIRSELAVPLEVNGEVRGVLNVDSNRLGAFADAERELLEALAAQGATVIRNTWLYEQLRLKARMFESLADVSQVITSALNLDDALPIITREACLLMGAKMSSLMLLDTSGEWLELRASHGAGESYLKKPRLLVQESAVGVVVRRKKPTQIKNVQVSGKYQNVDVARQEGLFGLLSVPLLFSGSCIGALNVYTDKPYVFSNEEIRILSALAQLSAIAIEKARLYERLVNAEEQLRQNEKLSALGLLAAELAHEIRNPLTVMKMLYHSMDLRFPADDPRAKDARIIGEKMEHLNRVVEQALDFARTAEPRLGPVDLNQVLEELTLLLRHKLKSQSIASTIQLQPGLPPVRGDTTQLEQALLNLILNATEAMPEGGTLTLATRSGGRRRGRAVPSQVLVEIIDSGRGMTQEQQRNAFRSVLASTKLRGTGLGLALVRRIVEAHRGRIKIVSRLGQGTKVTLRLPTF